MSDGLAPSGTPSANGSGTETRSDLCSVRRDGHRVHLYFGRRRTTDEAGQGGALESASAGWGMELLQRVTLGESGAAQLQDLLARLLSSAPGTPPRG